MNGYGTVIGAHDTLQGDPISPIPMHRVQIREYSSTYPNYPTPYPDYRTLPRTAMCAQFARPFSARDRRVSHPDSARPLPLPVVQDNNLLSDNVLKIKYYFFKRIVIIL